MDYSSEPRCLGKLTATPAGAPVYLGKGLFHYCQIAILILRWLLEMIPPPCDVFTLHRKNPLQGLQTSSRCSPKLVRSTWEGLEWWKASREWCNCILIWKNKAAQLSLDSCFGIFLFLGILFYFILVGKYICFGFKAGSLVSLCSPGCRTRNDLVASASWMPGLQAWVTTPGFFFFFDSCITRNFYFIKCWKVFV